MTLPAIDIKIPDTRTKYVLGLITTIFYYFLILNPADSSQYDKIAKMSMIVFTLFYILFFYENFNLPILPSTIFGLFCESAFLFISTSYTNIAAIIAGITLILIFAFCIRYRKQISTKRPWTRE